MTNQEKFLTGLGYGSIPLPDRKAKHPRGDFTFTMADGRVIDLHNIRPEDIVLEDIAISLARNCRFLGHTRNWCCVASHSIRTLDKLLTYFPQADPKVQRTMLMHDAAESICHDIIAPYKQMNLLGDFLEFAGKVEDQVVAKYDLYDYRDPAMWQFSLLDKMVCGDEQAGRNTLDFKLTDFNFFEDLFYETAIKLGVRED